MDVLLLGVEAAVKYPGETRAASNWAAAAGRWWEEKVLPPRLRGVWPTAGDQESNPSPAACPWGRDTHLSCTHISVDICFARLAWVATGSQVRSETMSHHPSCHAPVNTAHAVSSWAGNGYLAYSCFSFTNNNLFTFLLTWSNIPPGPERPWPQNQLAQHVAPPERASLHVWQQPPLPARLVDTGHSTSPGHLRSLRLEGEIVNEDNSGLSPFMQVDFQQFHF